jgi:adenylate cyclase class 2
MGKAKGEKRLEVEVKARVKDLKAVEAKVKAMGFTFEGTEEHSDIYFKHPSRDFASTDEALRIRTLGGKSVLTYKGPKVDKVSKTREEVEVEVRGDMARVLDRVGFTPVLNVSKVRRVYKKGDIEVCLDDVDGLGTFVEVECVSTDLEATRERVMSVMKSLGIQESLFERRAYLELLLIKNAGN